MLARARTAPVPAKGTRRRRRRSAEELVEHAEPRSRGSARDDGLFEQLRALRRQIAEREHVPAYVVFHDATLQEMAAARPRTSDELLEINGVGEKKLQRYGEEFLDQIRRAPQAGGSEGVS